MRQEGHLYFAIAVLQRPHRPELEGAEVAVIGAASEVGEVGCEGNLELCRA